MCVFAPMNSIPLSLPYLCGRVFVYNTQYFKLVTVSPMNCVYGYSMRLCSAPCVNDIRYPCATDIFAVVM